MAQQQAASGQAFMQSAGTLMMAAMRTLRCGAIGVAALATRSVAACIVEVAVEQLLTEARQTISPDIDAVRLDAPDPQISDGRLASHLSAQAADCTNEAKARPCALCAQFGHTKATCPSLVCFKCNRTGHVARDCTYSFNSR